MPLTMMSLKAYFIMLFSSKEGVFKAHVTRILSLLNNKTACGHKYMSDNMPAVTATGRFKSV